MIAIYLSIYLYLSSIYLSPPPPASLRSLPSYKMRTRSQALAARTSDLPLGPDEVQSILEVGKRGAAASTRSCRGAGGHRCAPFCLNMLPLYW